MCNGVSGYYYSKFLRRSGLSACLTALLWFALTEDFAMAQEALRGSMAGDTAAASYQAAGSTLGYYNLLIGPTAWRFNSALSFTYNDNATLGSNGGGGDDLIIAPSISSEIHWPVSLRNSLDVSISAGYSDYVFHPNLSQFFINPGSGLSFDIYVGNFRINLHDRVSISQSAVLNPGISGNGQNLVSLQNSSGVTGDMDLDKGEATLGYDHSIYGSLNNNQNQTSSDSDNFFANAGYRFVPQVLTGVEAGMSLINGQPGSGGLAASPDAVQYSSGVFSSATISEYLTARLDLGYEIYNQSSTGTNGASNGSGFYFSASISHRVNKYLNYTLTAGRSTDLASYGQVQDRLYVQVAPNWNIFEHYSLSTPLSWQHGSAVGIGTQTYDQYSGGISVGRSLTKKLSSSFSYNHIKETGSGTAAHYDQNTIGLSFSYQF